MLVDALDTLLSKKQLEALTNEYAPLEKDKYE